ncbi:hypothetical protein BTVI_02685 [Pitangus sulphuratus]|nr:hypothetical protein BTVI_02685 [Pitangus sulphuratus]
MAEESSSGSSGSPGAGDTLPWNLGKHQRSQRAKAAAGNGTVLDPAERAVIRIAGTAGTGGPGRVWGSQHAQRVPAQCDEGARVVRRTVRRCREVMWELRARPRDRRVILGLGAVPGLGQGYRHEGCRAESC